MGRRRRRGGRADAAGALPEAIAALSRTLPAGPSPETFRRAKFDRPEAAPALWRLLFRVLSPLQADCASASLAPEAQARWVKSALLSQGYPRRGLAQLPEDGSRGSRELLLSLSWLLAREPLLERLLVQTRVRLGDEMPVCECEALASPGLPGPHVEIDCPVDVRHLQWLMGKLRFRWRNLMASQQEQCALLGKIHLYTRGCHSDRSFGHLSVAETELLRNPEGGQQGQDAEVGMPAWPLVPAEPAFLFDASLDPTWEGLCWALEVLRQPLGTLSCCGGCRARTPAWRRPWSGSAGSWSSGSGWTRSWTPAPRRPRSLCFCPVSGSVGLLSWSWWPRSCRPCRRTFGRRWKPGGRPGWPGLETRGRSGTRHSGPHRRPHRRPWVGSWRLCGRPGSKAGAWPSPMGPTGS